MMHPLKNVPMPVDDKSSSMELPQIHADTIGRLVLEKFMEVIKGQEPYSRRKVLAGMVMTEDLNFNEAKIFTLFKNTTANESIFVRNPENGQYPYKLKSGVHFHLYINTAPCGDARIFSPHENDSGVDKHPNRKARGQLRTKIESGEGTIPVKSSDGIQTWDGVLQVISVSTGTKCVSGEHMSVNGAVLNDSHAEIVSRRCLMKFLYDQLGLHANP
uniref:A to I editase domain-containing protein n=1 Tax=Megaselia scalaris TaxID=36166 RepID=T1GVA8_MEGSC